MLVYHCQSDVPACWIIIHSLHARAALLINFACTCTLIKEFFLQSTTCTGKCCIFNSTNSIVSEVLDFFTVVL